MSVLHKIFRVCAVLTVFAVYGTVLWMGLTEESRRALTIDKSSATNDDFVIANVRITGVDTGQGLLHGRIRLIPMGRFAIDNSTPATDLTLLINSASEKQALVFPKKQRITPIEFTSLLSGNQNRYPFDRHTADIDLIITAPAKKKAEPLPADIFKENASPSSTTLIVGSSDLDNNETIPINENFIASIPGIKFEGAISENDSYKLMHTTVTVRRANNVISISIFVMIVTFLLAVSVVAMVLHVSASPGEINLLPLSLCVTLLFGLPALRSIQPNVPPVGILSDSMSFIWAELMVSISAIALAWAWIIRSRKNENNT